MPSAEDRNDGNVFQILESVEGNTYSSIFTDQSYEKSRNESDG